MPACTDPAVIQALFAGYRHRQPPSCLFNNLQEWWVCCKAGEI